MNRKLFEKIHEKRAEKRSITKPGKKRFIKNKERFGSAGFSFDESMIEDILYEFFLLFYTMIKDLPDTDIDSIIEFINFPEGTKIETTIKLAEKRIPTEAKIALEMAMDYFAEYYHQAHSEFMRELFEEVQIVVLCMLSKRGHIFRLSKDGREVFNHKVKLHSRFADERMLIDKITGAEIKWTEERKRKAVKRMEELEDLLSRCKSLSLEETNAKKRAKKIVDKIPTLKPHEEKINLLLTKESKSSVKDTASQILKEELNKMPGFKLESADYLKRRIADFKRDLEKKAA